MAEFILWLNIPGRQRVKMIVEDHQPLSWLKEEALAESGLPRFGPDDRPLNYRIVKTSTGKSLADEAAPISDWAKNGDQITIQKAVEKITAANVDRGMIPPPLESRGKTALPAQSRPSITSVSQVFSLTGVPPFNLDFSKEYPVLAVIYRYLYTGVAKRSINTSWAGLDNPQPERKPIYAKDIFFLTAGADGKFCWVSPSESSCFSPGLSAYYPEHNRRMTRYGLNKFVGDKKNMIYPVRPFSITAIEMDGFSADKDYPVLAIDVDQYVQENPEEEDSEEQQPTTKSMAFFLVGDDNGEFAWIAEDECRLYPLT
jgi:hypothetical protein